MRLVVLDSIAHPFRGLDMSDGGARAARAETLYRVAVQLKALAQSYNLAVVISNQVGDCMDDAPSSLVEQSTGGAPLVTSGRRVTPALGMHWAHCVTTRLFLSRATRPGALAAEREVSRRLRVLYAPHLAADAVRFVIQSTGVHGLDDDEAEADAAY